MIKRIQTLVVLVCFACNLGLPSVSFSASSTFLDLPVPGTMLSTSQAFTPALIKGVQLNPQNPLEFNFIVDTGDSRISGEQLKTESAKMVKYFLASLTVPDKELWVNLSPYEKDRIIPQSFGMTEMGRDLLAQDYILKQLTASLVYPEKDLGKSFWEKAYKLAQEKMGTTNVPVNTFNKVWIIPDNATVYEHNGSAFVVNSHLKVMLEEDYLALQNNLNNKKFGTAGMEAKDTQTINSVASQAVRDVLIPAIETEVNTGKNFANLRQVYNSMILAIWYKQNLKEALLNQVYSNQNKTKGIDVQDKASKEKIYSQYLAAFKKGVYNYIKEDRDPATNTTVPRKYFSGGAVAPSRVAVKTDLAMLGNDERAALPDKDRAMNVQVRLFENATRESLRPDAAMVADQLRDRISAQFQGRLQDMDLEAIVARLLPTAQSIVDNGKKFDILYENNDRTGFAIIDATGDEHGSRLEPSAGEISRGMVPGRRQIRVEHFSVHPADATDAAMMTTTGPEFAQRLQREFEAKGERIVPIILNYPDNDRNVNSQEKLSKLIELFQGNDRSVVFSKDNEGKPRVTVTFRDYKKEKGVTPTVYIAKDDLLHNFDAAMSSNKSKFGKYRNTQEVQDRLQILVQRAMHDHRLFPGDSRMSPRLVVDSLLQDALRILEEGAKDIKVVYTPAKIETVGEPVAHWVVTYRVRLVQGQGEKFSVSAADTAMTIRDDKVVKVREEGNTRVTSTYSSLSGRTKHEVRSRVNNYGSDSWGLDSTGTVWQDGNRTGNSVGETKKALNAQELAAREYLGRGDDAMTSVVKSSDPFGGINLDPAMLNLQIKRDGKGIPLPINQQPIGNMKIDGFMPVIINVTPINDLPLLLGLNDKEPALALSR